MPLTPAAPLKMDLADSQPSRAGSLSQLRCFMKYHKHYRKKLIITKCAAPGMQGSGKEAGTPTFSFAFPIQLLCDLVFVFPCPVYLDNKLCRVGTISYYEAEERNKSK